MVHMLRSIVKERGESDLHEDQQILAKLGLENAEP